MRQRRLSAQSFIFFGAETGRYDGANYERSSCHHSGTDVYDFDTVIGPFWLTAIPIQTAAWWGRGDKMENSLVG